ncbi:uncharacterized protein [Gossypium hirsutum]|uniref:Uncharacterized protein n=1 Tax=Gossypium hirsutum TaxID=3635 RepID=A0ABM3BBU9_GOSHI|nr:uncharacterized protein LOC121224952 [Gossypium hirsutum]
MGVLLFSLEKKNLSTLSLCAARRFIASFEGSLNLALNSDDNGGRAKGPIVRPGVRRGTWRVQRRGRAHTESRHMRREGEEVLLLRRWEPLLLGFLASGLG